MVAQLRQRADRAGDDRQPGRHRLGGREAERLGRARRHDRQRRRARAARASSCGARRAREASSACPAPRASSAARCGPSPATTSGRPAAAQAAIATSTPFSGASRDTTSACSPGGGRRALRRRRARHGRRRGPACRRSGAPSSRRRSQRERARHDHRVGVLDEPALPQRERGAVDRRLGTGAAAVAPHAGQRVAAVAAGAVRTAREARADRADEAVVVQVQHRPRARRARGRERPPAERRVQVVRVDDPRAGAPHGVGDLLGRQAAAEQPGRRAGAADRRAVARRAAARPRRGARARATADPSTARSSPPGRPVAVVQEQDHAAAAVRRESPESVGKVPSCQRAGPWMPGAARFAQESWLDSCGPVAIRRRGTVRWRGETFSTGS